MKVVLHADDFGLTAGVNQGIMQTFAHGLLTSASLMASGEAAGQALQLAAETPDLDVGVHLTLCDERPVLPARFVGTLVTGQGVFPSRAKIFARILGGRIDYAQVRAEWRAQIERALAAGIVVSHLDGHQFVHLLPGLFHVCQQLAGEYAIGHVRSDLADRPTDRVGLGRSLQWVGLKSWIATGVRPFKRPSLAGPAAVGFCLAGGRLTAEDLIGVLTHLARRRRLAAVEVMLHPGTGDRRTRAKYRHWGYDWSADRDLLLAPALKTTLDRLGMVPSSYRQLP